MAGELTSPYVGEGSPALHLQDGVLVLQGWWRRVSGSQVRAEPEGELCLL